MTRPVWYQGLEVAASAMVDVELASPGKRGVKLPRLMPETLKAVHSTKWKLVRLRQEQGKSYKEVCAPMVDKCRFLMTELRPYYKSLQGLPRVRLLHREPRLKSVARRVIRQRRDRGNPDTNGSTEDENDLEVASDIIHSVENENLQEVQEDVDNCLDAALPVVNHDALNASIRSQDAALALIQSQSNQLHRDNSTTPDGLRVGSDSGDPSDHRQVVSAQMLQVQSSYQFLFYDDDYFLLNLPWRANLTLI